MSLIGYGVGSAWQSIAHGIAFAGYGIGGFNWSSQRFS